MIRQWLEARKGSGRALSAVLISMIFFILLFCRDLNAHRLFSDDTYFAGIRSLQAYSGERSMYPFADTSARNGENRLPPLVTPFALFVILLLFLALGFCFVSIRRKNRLLKGLQKDLEDQRRENRSLTDKLFQAQMRFQSFFNFMPIALLLIDEEGIICQSNARACHDFGFKLDGRRLRDLIDPEEAEKLELALDCVLGGFNQSLTVSMMGVSRKMPCRIMLAPITGESTPRVLCALFDESERIDLENRIRERTRLLEKVIDGIPVATFMIDTTGKVLIWNRASELITGIGRDEVIGKMLDLKPLFGGRELPVPALLLLEHSPEEIGAKFRGRIRQHDQFPNAVEARGMIFAGREERYVHIVAAGIHDDEGKLIGVVQCAKDVTEELRLRENVFQIQKMEAIGRLVSGIAHDLNNALTVILGGCDLLGICLDDRENAERYLQEIRGAVQRAGKLVERLLGYSKRQRFLPRTVDINENVRNAVSSIADALGEDITVELQLDSRPILCRVDPFHLEQSVVNLIVNAREAISSGGRITVTTGIEKIDKTLTIHHFSVPRGVYARISVSDNGSGIEKEILKHIFEPYFTTKKGGSGLGLAMVYGFVNQSGGHITVDSTVGKGTTFTIYLPLVAADQENFDNSGNNQKVKNILVVEDDPTIREILQSTLSSAGYAVRTADSFEQALTLFQEGSASFDLLIVDVVLPDRSGWEVAEALLKIKPDLKVLYMTGYNGQYLEKLGLTHEKLKQIIQKPFTTDELLRRIKEIS